MNDYIPDRWVVIKINTTTSVPVYKIFACWFGGWAGSNSWRLNSGITKASLQGFVYSFSGSSGSVYECHRDTYGTHMYGNSVLNNMIDKAKLNGITIEILPIDTNWLEVNYE